MPLAVTPVVTAMAERYPDVTVEIVRPTSVSIDIVGEGFDAGIRLGEMIARGHGDGATDATVHARSSSPPPPMSAAMVGHRRGRACEPQLHRLPAAALAARSIAGICRSNGKESASRRAARLVTDSLRRDRPRAGRRRTRLSVRAAGAGRCRRRPSRRGAAATGNRGARTCSSTFRAGRRWRRSSGPSSTPHKRSAGHPCGRPAELPELRSPLCNSRTEKPRRTFPWNCLGGYFLTAAATSAAKSVSSFSMPSPSAKRR